MFAALEIRRLAGADHAVQVRLVIVETIGAGHDLLGLVGIGVDQVDVALARNTLILHQHMARIARQHVDHAAAFGLRHIGIHPVADPMIA